jgi:hypothetical protein
MVVIVGLLVAALAAVCGAFPKAVGNYNSECVKILAVPVL